MRQNLLQIMTNISKPGANLTMKNNHLIYLILPFKSNHNLQPAFSFPKVFHFKITIFWKMF